MLVGAHVSEHAFSSSRKVGNKRQHAAPKRLNPPTRLQHAINKITFGSVPPSTTMTTPRSPFHPRVYIQLGGRIILGWIFRKWDVGVWTGLGWLRIETVGEQL
jgi:hypothetical protein